MKKQKELEEELKAQYGKIIIKSLAQYWGGYRRQVEGGIYSPFSMGMMYLFENYFLFRADVAKQSNYWEILIPINSIITENWDPENSKNNKSGEGIKISEDKVYGKKQFTIPYVDDNGIKQEPIFGIIGNFGTKKAVGAASWWGGGGITKWMQVFYDTILKNKNKTTQSTIDPEYDVDEWIRDGEGPTLEFKSHDILSEPHKLAKSMVAFGNNKSVKGDIGGRIIIGIKDEGRSIEGVKVNSKHEEHIMNIARGKCVPPIQPTFKRINHLGKSLYVITIPKMKELPFQMITKDGGVHYIRVGSTNRSAHPNEVAQLYGKPENQSEDERVRSNQVLQELVNNFESLKGKMEYLGGLAISKELLITQFKNYVDGKNQLVDKTKEIATNPLVVLNKELKDEIIGTLQQCRYRPAWEAIEPSLKLARQTKMLQNGWSRDSLDFEVGERLVDNNTIEAIEATTNLLNRLKPLLEMNSQE